MRAWRAWRLPGRWPDGGRRSTVAKWTRRRAAPAYAPIADLTFKTVLTTHVQASVLSISGACGQPCTTARWISRGAARIADGTGLLRERNGMYRGGKLPASTDSARDGIECLLAGRVDTLPAASLTDSYSFGLGSDSYHFLILKTINSDISNADNLL